MSDALLSTREHGILTLTLNRPAARNALDQALVEELTRALQALPEDESVRVVVLTGAGQGFCAGADLKTTNVTGGMEAGMDAGNALIRALSSAPQPCIAAIRGGAVGYGASLALACDFLVMAEGAYLNQKFVKIGLMPDGGSTWFVPHAIGLHRALELALLGDDLPAARAVELGLATRAVPEQELEPTVRALAERLAAGPPLAMAAIKQGLRCAASGTLEQALEYEKRAQLQLFGSQDVIEGVLAWMQRRSPAFRGR